MEATEAWPEYFASKDSQAFPSTDADMSEFKWEEPTESSYEEDLAAIMEASEHITVTEGPAEPSTVSIPQADLEWT